MTRITNDLNVCVRVNYAYTGVASVPLWAALVSDEQGYEYTIEPMTRVAIDPNVRVRGNGTYAGFEDVSGPITVGDHVEVYEAESNLVGQGRVTEIDVKRELVYLSVDWSSLSDEASPRLPEAGTTAGHVLFLPVSTALPDSEPPWMSLVARPALGYLAAKDSSMTLVAAAFGWSTTAPCTWPLSTGMSTSTSSTSLSTPDYVVSELMAVTA